MKLDIFTHGKHQKGGNTVDTYDGSLTADGLAAVKQNRNKLGTTYDAIFRGTMVRHVETATALGVNALADKDCCNDAEMFALVEAGDEVCMDRWFAFMDALKTMEKQSVLIITSRLYPIMMLHRQFGGHAKVGGLREFCNTCENLMGLPGVVIPQLTQANLTSWEY